MEGMKDWSAASDFSWVGKRAMQLSLLARPAKEVAVWRPPEVVQGAFVKVLKDRGGLQSLCKDLIFFTKELPPLVKNALVIFCFGSGNSAWANFLY